MATYTENYNLEKPAQSDLYNIDVFNENADKIDEALGGKAENQSLAPIESSATASRNYSVGQQFVYNGLLYEATSAIASGGTITPGSNCARTTVAEELSALNDAFANYKQITSTDVVAEIQSHVTTTRLDSAKVTRCGNIVNLVISNMSCSTAQTNTVILTGLPRPSVQQVISCPIYGDQTNCYRLGVSNTGVVTIACGTGLFYAVVTYIAAS